MIGKYGILIPLTDKSKKNSRDAIIPNMMLYLTILCILNRRGACTIKPKTPHTPNRKPKKNEVNIDLIILEAFTGSNRIKSDVNIMIIPREKI